MRYRGKHIYASLWLWLCLLLPLGLRASVLQTNGTSTDSLAPRSVDSLTALPISLHLPPLSQLIPQTAPSLRAKPQSAQPLFGAGGVRLRLSGSALLSGQLRRSVTDNPSLSEGERLQRAFALDQVTDANLTATVGTRLRLEMGYNSKARLSDELKRISLTYRGDSVHWLKRAEVGQVSLKPRNRLVQGAETALGVRTRLEWGSLWLDLMMNQSHIARRSMRPIGQSGPQSYRISALDYADRQHFFLSHFFRGHYASSLSTLPHISSPIHIERIEVWVSSSSASTASARDLVALQALGEQSGGASPNPPPGNDTDPLYSQLIAGGSLSSIHSASSALTSLGAEGKDYALLSSARLLSPSEYTLHPSLGYLSLHHPLSSNQTLSVAYEYLYDGQRYRVGTWSSERTDALLLTKLIHGTQLSPSAPYWDLVMRNVYPITSGGAPFSPEGLQLEALHQPSGASSPLPQLSNSAGQSIPLLQALGLDRLGAQGQAGSDGRIDYLEGVTALSHLGMIILPQLAPFSEGLAQAGIAPEYRFHELYRLPKHEAEKSKQAQLFALQGSYTLPSATEAELPTEQEQALAQQEGTELRRRTFGFELGYKPLPSLEATISGLYLSEYAHSYRPQLGAEAVRNFLWGASLSYNADAPWLTRTLQRIPLLRVQQPSHISLQIEAAQLRAGQSSDPAIGQGVSLDDFDSSLGYIDLMNTLSWHLGSPPIEALETANRSGDPTVAGHGRAQMAWYSIDPMFTRPQHRRMPSYLRENPELRERHSVREIEVRELFPMQEVGASTSAHYLPTLHLSFYPQERGPYNLSTARMGPDGLLTDPTESWGTVMRPLELSNLEEHGVEALEFWLMDPYADQQGGSGGDLYIDLGDISEDVLPDGYKSYENGLSLSGDLRQATQTPWGKVSPHPALSYTFDYTASSARAQQDVGLDGLGNQEEHAHSSYSQYLRQLSARISPSLWSEWTRTAHNPLQDPAGDDFRHFRSSLYDEQRADILTRYKYYNSTEGNSPEVGSASREAYMGSSTQPDVEDIDRDGSMQTSNRYHQWRISLRPHDLAIGQGYLTDIRQVQVQLPSGRTSTVRWLLFRIPLRQSMRSVGGASDLRSARFLRLGLKGWSEAVHLRFASLRLLRSGWRPFTQPLSPSSSVGLSAPLEIGSVSLIQDGTRHPINYVSPPESYRLHEGQGAGTMLANEQSLSLRTTALASGDVQAIYRATRYDLRPYRRLHLWAHSEALPQHPTPLEDGDIELFVRLGTDYQSHYYEYSLPLTHTPSGQYSNYSTTDREQVWPLSNRVDLDLEEWTRLKAERNAALRRSTSASTSTQPYSREMGQGRRISILGAPSLGNIRAVMIGIRNRSGGERAVEVWVNELQAREPRNEGGWALQSSLAMKLSDLGSVSAQWQRSTSGFGTVVQGWAERQQEDMQSLRIQTSWELGQFFPESAKVSLPIHTDFSHSISTPKYSPTQSDLSMADLRANLGDDALADSLQGQWQSRHITRQWSIPKAQVGIRSQTPMPYDPANLSLSLLHNQSQRSAPTLAYAHSIEWQAAISYDYTTAFKPLKPLAKLKGQSAWSKMWRDTKLSLWPSRVYLHTNLSRSYTEELSRTPSDALGVSSPTAQAIWGGHFIWQRRMTINWSPLPSLILMLNTGTDARIEEAHEQVNRALNPDGYERWKHSVQQSLSELGTPMRYNQSASLTYTAPTRLLPLFSWAGLQLGYQSHYTWAQGASRADGSARLPHIISNQLQLHGLLTLRLRQLYDRSPYLKGLSSRYAGTAPTLRSSSTTTEGKADSLSTLRRIADRGLYTLLMVKELSITLRSTQAQHIPGWLPSVGSAFGQRSHGGALSPGLGFAFALVGEDFVEQAMQRGLLADRSLNTQAATHSHTRTLEWKATLEPMRGLSITLLSNHTHSQRTANRYMYPDLGPQHSGELSMTTIGLRGILGRIGAQDGEVSSSQAALLEARLPIAERIDALTAGRHPADRYSPAVLIPAMRSAYTLASSPSTIELSALPSVLSTLPNWDISYHAPLRNGKLSKIIKSLSLKHTYRGIWRTDSYNTLPQWQAIRGQIGLHSPSIGSAPTVSLPHEVSSVSLQESLFPLIGLDVSLSIPITLSWQMRRSYALTLSPATARMIETQTQENNISLSYRTSDLWAVLSPARAKARKDKNRSGGGLHLYLDYSWGHTQSILHQLRQGISQSTAGLKHGKLTTSLEYDLSRMLTLRGYYEYHRHIPLTSSGAYPMYTHTYGLSLRFNLQQQ